MNGKILLLTDSLALARKYPESLLLEETWAARLRECLDGSYWLQLSLGGATSSDLLGQSDYWVYSAHEISVLIVQAGIVDCAPRAFTRREAVFQKTLAMFTRFFPRAGLRIFEALRRRRQISYVSSSLFRQNVRKFRDMAQRQGCRLIWVPVMGASFYDNILPGVLSKIAQTNHILREELADALLDVQLTDDCFMSDGHHLSPDGHRILAETLLARLRGKQD